MRGDKCYPARGKWVKISLLPGNVPRNLENLKRVTTERSKITVGSESNISELFGWPNVIPHFSTQFNYLFSLILSKTHGSHFK